MTAPVLTPDPWSALAALTPARVALGRAGTGLPTAANLDFAAAHAAARDAVHVPLDTEGLSARIRSLGLDTLIVSSAAASRAEYLRRPDRGRQLAEASASLLAAHAPAACQLALVLGDGLSAVALERQAPPLLAALLPLLPGWTFAPVVIATQARVALGDPIGFALHAEFVAVLIGERPGLSSPDSLSVYLTRAPEPGRTDAERNCLSNIRPEGLTHAVAARKLAHLLTAGRRLGLTGTRLKDETDASGHVPEGPLRVGAKQ